MEPNNQNSWLSEVKRIFDDVNQPQPKEPSIFRVPWWVSVKDSKVNAYKPKVISFGIYDRPLKVPLLPMEQYKMQAVRDMEGILFKDRRLLIPMVLPLVDKIKRCYEHFPEHLSEEEIAWLFTMDACFVLQFLNPKSDTPNFSRRKLLSWGITSDIFKLENQIPLFFLLGILQLELNSSPENRNGEVNPQSWLAEKLCHHELFQNTPFSLKSKAADVENHIDHACHLLDVLRRTIKPFLSPGTSASSSNANSAINQFLSPRNSHSSSPSASNINTGDTMQNVVNINQPLSTENSTSSTNAGGTQQNVITCSISSKGYKSIISSAEVLHKDGIRFQRSQSGKVGFEKGWLCSKLLIPQIYLSEDIEPILRNLMAFEDRLSVEEAIISQFMVLMDCLIECTKDVALLRSAGIIETRIGSNKDIAMKFNNLCKGFNDNCSNYEDVARQLEDHAKNPVNGWINSSKEEIRSKPWYVFSFVAATVLLALTAAQTYYAYKQTSYASDQ